MGAIRDQQTGVVRTLEPEHWIGRSPTSPLWLDQRFVSGRHAVIWWLGDHWELKDLGSRNGTFVNGSPIRPGEGRPLRQGELFAIGKREARWEFVDDSPPVPMAVPVEGGDPILIDGEFIAIPSTTDPRATIYRKFDGSWVVEQAGESTVIIRHRQVFEIDGQAFRFCCPQTVAKTSIAEAPLGLEVRHLQLLFSVSLDEEHVHLQVVGAGNTFDLGARAHHYLLLTLARHRLDDASRGFAETSCGWLYQEDLARDPAMAPPQLNIDVFRIRKQFAAIGVQDPANIVERRPRTHQLRIGASQLSVVTL